MLKTTWFITGGCGFIGRRLIRALYGADERAHIRVLDNLSVGDLESLRRTCAVDELADAAGPLPAIRPGRVQFVRGDVKDLRTVASAIAGANTVVHLAANTGVAPSVEAPLSDCANNVIGTLNVLESARQVGAKRFIFASSGAPVGEVVPPIHEEVVPHPVSPYGASKLAGEGYCSAYARTFGLETIVLRFGNVYGPESGHKSSVVAKFIKDAIESGVLHINGNGSQTRDFIYVDDLVSAVVASGCSRDAVGEVVQIATQRETSVREIAKIVEEKLSACGVPAPKIVCGEPRRGDVMRNYADTSKARRLLGWTATTSVEDGIEKTVLWFLESRHVAQ